MRSVDKSSETACVRVPHMGQNGRPDPQKAAQTHSNEFLKRLDHTDDEMPAQKMACFAGQRGQSLAWTGRPRDARPGRLPIWIKVVKADFTGTFPISPKTSQAPHIPCTPPQRVACKQVIAQISRHGAVVWERR